MKIGIKIEEVGDVNNEYNYLEVFFEDSVEPFLDIGVSEERKLVFKFYKSNKEFFLDVEEWEVILDRAKKFLPIALQNADDIKNMKWDKE